MPNMAILVKEAPPFSKKNNCLLIKTNGSLEWGSTQSLMRHLPTSMYAQ